VPVDGPAMAGAAAGGRFSSGEKTDRMVADGNRTWPRVGVAPADAEKGVKPGRGDFFPARKMGPFPAWRRRRVRPYRMMRSPIARLDRPRLPRLPGNHEARRWRRRRPAPVNEKPHWKPGLPGAESAEEAAAFLSTHRFAWPRRAICRPAFNTGMG